MLAFLEWMSSRNLGSDVSVCKLKHISLINLCSKVRAAFMTLRLLRSDTNHISECDKTGCYFLFVCLAGFFFFNKTRDKGVQNSILRQILLSY